MAVGTAFRKGSEHWLTTMTCSMCEKTPDASPLYRCNMGHLLCTSCFEHLAVKGVPRCMKCNSVNFMSFQVSMDFLKKLKYKPTLGRKRFPRRCSSPEEGYPDMEDEGDQTATLEKIFQMPKNQIEKLFSSNSQHQKPDIVAENKNVLNPLKSSSCFAKCISNSCKTPHTLSSPGASHNKAFLTKEFNASVQRNDSMTNLLSKKPLRCPHDPCSKMIAVSSFNSHFKYEHSNIKKYYVKKGEELNIAIDASSVEFNSSFCLGLITVYDTNKINISSNASRSVVSVVQKFNQQMPLGTFWLMVSGSPDGRLSRAYILYWLFSNSDELYKCTIEISSQQEKLACSTFCNVNSVHESQEITEVAQRLNSLYLTYGTLHSLLEEGPELNLRIIVH